MSAENNLQNSSQLLYRNLFRVFHLTNFCKWRLVSLILVAVGFLSLSKVALAQDVSPSKWGIVKYNSFVIPSSGQEWTHPRGVAAGKRIGYLEIGTVVKIGECRHVNGPDDESTGKYCRVESENGVSGMTLSSRVFTMIRGKAYAVAIDATPEGRIDLSPSGSFSRNSGVIVEIVGNPLVESRDSDIKVVPLYNPPEDPVQYFMKRTDLKDKNKIKVVKYPEGDIPPLILRPLRNETGTLVLRSENVNLWKYFPVNHREASQIASQLPSVLGWANSLIQPFQTAVMSFLGLNIQDRNRFLCSSSEITGLLVALVTNSGTLFSEQDDFLKIDFDILKKNDNFRYVIITEKTVQCDADSWPRSVSTASLILMRNGPDGNGNKVLRNKDTQSTAVIRLTDEMIRRIESLRVPAALDANNNPKLFEISKFEHYNSARSFVQRRIKEGGISDNLPQGDQDALTHALISKFALFPRSID